MRAEGFEEIWTRWSRVSEKKKKDAEPEMGYCPFEHKAGHAGAQVEVRRGTGHGAQGHGTQARGTGLAARARGLGVLLGCGLCTWCTQPVFDPV